MSSHQTSSQVAQAPDAIASGVPVIHFVLPLVGGVLMLLLSFIAVFLA